MSHSFDCIITHNYFIVYNSMIIHRIATLVLLAVLLTISQGQKTARRPTRSEVIELQPTIFQDTVYSSTDPWLLYLYAPWCEPCQEVHAEFDRVSIRLKGRVKLAKIDPSKNQYRPRFHQLFGLHGFPHIVLLHAGAKEEGGEYDVFEGARDAKSMIQWTQERMKIHKSQALDRIISHRVWEEDCIETGSLVCIVTLLPSLADSSEAQRNVYLQIVRSVIKSYRDKPVGFLWAAGGDHEEFQAIFNVNSVFPAAVLVNPQKGVYTTMKGSLTEENMEKWLAEAFKPKGSRQFSKFSHKISFDDIRRQEKEAKQVQGEVVISDQL